MSEVKSFRAYLCPRAEIAAFIKKWHYLHSIQGVTDSYCFKLGTQDGRLIGAMIYGRLPMPGIWKIYVHNPESLLELRRFCLVNSLPPNIASRFIGWSLRWLRHNTTVKSVVSYADPSWGHDGAIYKADNPEKEGK